MIIFSLLPLLDIGLLVGVAILIPYRTSKSIKFVNESLYCQPMVELHIIVSSKCHPYSLGLILSSHTIVCVNCVLVYMWTGCRLKRRFSSDKSREVKDRLI